MAAVRRPDVDTPTRFVFTITVSDAVSTANDSVEVMVVPRDGSGGGCGGCGSDREGGAPLTFLAIMLGALLVRRRRA